MYSGAVSTCPHPTLTSPEDRQATRQMPLPRLRSLASSFLRSQSTATTGRHTELSPGVGTAWTWAKFGSDSLLMWLPLWCGVWPQGLLSRARHRLGAAAAACRLSKEPTSNATSSCRREIGSTASPYRCHAASSAAPSPPPPLPRARPQPSHCYLRD